MLALTPASALFLEFAALIGATLLAHRYAVQHFTVDDVPTFLWRRIQLIERLRPVALVGAVVLGVAGVALTLR